MTLPAPERRARRIPRALRRRIRHTDFPGRTLAILVIEVTGLHIAINIGNGLLLVAGLTSHHVFLSTGSF